jgi:hypothetical protein
LDARLNEGFFLFPCELSVRARPLLVWLHARPRCTKALWLSTTKTSFSDRVLVCRANLYCIMMLFRPGGSCPPSWSSGHSWKGVIPTYVPLPHAYWPRFPSIIHTEKYLPIPTKKYQFGMQLYWYGILLVTFIQPWPCIEADASST